MQDNSVLINNCEVNVWFVNNSALSGGPSIYISNPESCIREGDNPPFTNSLIYDFPGSNAAEQVSNSPNRIYLYNQTSTNIWVGQALKLCAYSSISPLLELY